MDGEENADKTLGELWGRSWYAYRYVGSTQGGLDVVHTRHSGGGSGIFNRVVFTRTEMDRGVDYPLLREVESRTAAARPEVRDRELIRFVGKIPLGDRWLGTVEVVGNDVVFRGRDLYERCELGGATARTAAAVGGTMRAPVLASRSRSSAAVRSTSSHRRVRISLSRHPVSIKRRSAAAACAGTRPSASRAPSTRPSRRYSCSVRNRSRLRRLYLTTERQGLPPSRDRPQASPRENIWERISSTRFAARGVSRSP